LCEREKEREREREREREPCMTIGIELSSVNLVLCLISAISHPSSPDKFAMPAKLLSNFGEFSLLTTAYELKSTL